MADAQARKSVRFQDGSDILYIPLNQQEDSSDTGSDETDETIRPGHSSPYMCSKDSHSPPESSQQGLSQSTIMSNDGLVYMSGASTSTTPLLNSPRRRSYPPTANTTCESQFRDDKAVGYGAMVAPSSRTAMQQTRSVSSRYRDTHIEAVPGPETSQRRHFLRAWLREFTLPARTGIWREAAPVDEESARLDSEEAAICSLKWSMTMRCRRLAFVSARLRDRIWRSPIARTTLALGFMLLLSVGVFGIGYRVHKLAMLIKRYR